jgi:hypothetical protein
MLMFLSVTNASSSEQSRCFNLPHRREGTVRVGFAD